ncbi:MAG: aminotransferase class V-fold PLP-dependent enzyme [Oscillospiraceae bacterium]
MVYFDNAATTYPKPVGVLNSAIFAIRDYGGNPGRSSHAFAAKISEKIFDTRVLVANLFNAQPENVVFTSNCTHSLNIAIKGLLNENDHVIISCLEHNSVIRPIYKLLLEKNVTYSVAEYNQDDNITVNNFLKLIKKNTKMIVCTHASNVSGAILPIEKIGKLCKNNGILFCVDAAQSAGVLPIDINECKIDALCMPGHKGLYGVTGTGVLVLNKEILPSSIMQGGTGSASFDFEQPDFLPDRLESGTANTVGICSLASGIAFINEKGMKNIYAHESKLCEYVKKTLSKNENIIVYGNKESSCKSAPIVSFNVKGTHSNVTAEWLNKKGFALRPGLHCSPLAHEYYKTSEIGMVRFSPSAFSSQVNVEACVKNVLDFAKKYG